MRKEITVAQLSDAVRNGMDHILDDIQAEGVAVVRDKYGNVKGKLKINNLEIEKNATINRTQEHTS